MKSRPQLGSSTQRFIAARGINPLEQIINELRNSWSHPQANTKSYLAAGSGFWCKQAAE